VLSPGDVLPGGHLMSGWVGMYLLKQRGVDTVSLLSAHHRTDFPKGIRLGKEDHLVVWKKPTAIRSVDRATYNALVDAITVREVRFRVEQPGFRPRSIVVTTLLNPGQAGREELAELYRARWNNELDLRSIKLVLQMDRLQCKTPELVREEIWAHALAYNLIRTVMAQAAAGEGVDQFQSDAASAGGVPATDRPPRPPRRGALGDALRGAAPGHRGPSGRRPARPVRARNDQVTAEGVRKPDEAAESDQTPDTQTS
jgi:hypothetical protein